MWWLYSTALLSDFCHGTQGIFISWHSAYHFSVLIFQYATSFYPLPFSSLGFFKNCGFFWPHPAATWKFLDQGFNPNCSCNLCHSCNNNGSLTDYIHHSGNSLLLVFLKSCQTRLLVVLEHPVYCFMAFSNCSCSVFCGLAIPFSVRPFLIS